jgi:hypothetical protein
VPRVGGAPPFGGQQLVGFATWLWTSNAAPLSAQASVPGLTATVRATPTTTTWTFTPDSAPPQAQAESITCRADAPPYDADLPDSQQHSDCTHTFTWHGTYRVTATTRWAVSWTATTGQSGALPDLQAATVLDLTVQEGQATTD